MGEKMVARRYGKVPVAEGECDPREVMMMGVAKHLTKAIDKHADFTDKELPPCPGESREAFEALMRERQELNDQRAKKGLLTVADMIDEECLEARHAAAFLGAEAYREELLDVVAVCLRAWLAADEICGEGVR